MGQKSDDYLAASQAKEDRLDWHKFNFLENLLVFCIMAERSVPKESGVHFRINLDAANNRLCLLFNTDRKHDSLIKGEIPRPDYMVLFAREKECLCTIIEMKGKGQKNLEHGINQIKVLRDQLKREFNSRLPNKFRVKFQGVLLTPPNSQIPFKKLTYEASQGLTIIALQSDKKADLYNYVSKENKLTDGGKVIESRKPKENDRNQIEELLMCNSLSSRILDSFYQETYVSKYKPDGIYINYALEVDSYATFAATNDGLTIAIREHDDNGKDFLEKALTQIGLRYIRDFTWRQVE